MTTTVTARTNAQLVMDAIKKLDAIQVKAERLGGAIGTDIYWTAGAAKQLLREVQA